MKISKYYFSILIILIFSIFLRFFWLGNQSFWLDEGYSLILSDGRSIQENLSRILNREAGDKYQILYYLILFYWRLAFGENEFAIRTLSALLGVASVITVFFTTLRIYGKKYAFWSTLLLSFSSFGIYYSQEARTYSLLIFLVSLQLFCFSKVLNEDKKNEIVSICFFCIFTALGLFSSVLMAVFSAALCLSHIIVYKKLKHWLQWWIPALVFSSPILLFYFSSPAATDPTGTLVTRVDIPIVQNAIFVIYGILVGTTYGPPLSRLRFEDKIQVLINYGPQFIILLIVVSILFISLGIVILNSRRNDKYQQANYFFAILLALSFLFALIFAGVTKINLVARHAFFLYVPFSIIAPLTLNQKYKIKRLKAKFIGNSQSARFAIILLLILNIYSISNYYFNRDYWKDDYRSVAQYLVKNRNPSAKSIMLWGTTRLMSYYGDTLTIDGRIDGPNHLKKENFAEQVRNLTNSSDTVFIVVNREFYWGSPNEVQRLMSDLYKLQSKISFNYFNIYRFVKK
jgi:uncharacterized membrane protein